MASPTPNFCAIVYIIIAVIVSIYHAYRGFMFQWLLGLQQVQGAHRVILLCIADMLTYFICTMSGFVALLLLFHSGIASAHLPTSGGEATWFIFLAVYGLLGVTGKLPEILSRVTLPGGGGHQ